MFVNPICVEDIFSGTTLEFVLKDISTVANSPGNLTQWAATVDAVVDRYY